MKDEIYLVCNKRGVTRMAKKPTYVGKDEILIRVTVLVPDGYFKSHIPSVELVIVEPPVREMDDIEIRGDVKF